MILTYLYDINELNNLSDDLIVSLKDYSFLTEKMYSLDEIIDLKLKLTNKRIYLSLNCLYKDNEIKELEKIITKLSNLDGFIIQDFGLFNIFRKLNIMNKIIYAPETFITTHLDSLYFKNLGINNLLLSREITLKDINNILDKSDSYYAYISYGYQMMFYSIRPHFSNFNDQYNYDYNLKNSFNIKIKEETRNEYYNSIEDNRGFRIYKDKIFNAYKELINSKIKYHILSRIFINNDEYYDTVKLYLNEINYSEYAKKYNNQDKGYLYTEVGLLKE